MNIGSKYRITSDSMNIILEVKHKVKSRKTGKLSESWAMAGYFFRLRDVLNFLVNTGILETKLVDLKTITDKQQELYDLINNITKEGE